MRQSTDSDSVDRFKIHWYLNLELSVILVLNRIKQLAQVTERRHSVNILPGAHRRRLEPVPPCKILNYWTNFNVNYDTI